MLALLLLRAEDDLDDFVQQREDEVGAMNR